MSSNTISLESFPWITPQFVDDLIRKSEGGDNWDVESFDIGNFENNGQNFSSIIIRLNVNIRERSNQSNLVKKSFFVKMTIKSEDFANASKESLLFEKEIEVYSKILPAVEELLESIGVPTQIGPK